MRTKKFLYNSAAAALLTITTLVIGLILPRLYLTIYGSEVNGLIATIYEFISYFSYVEAGLGTALTYGLFKPLATRDEHEINTIVSVAKRSYIKISGLYLLMVVFLAFLYPFLIKKSTIDFTTIFLLILVIGTYGALDLYTMSKYRVLLVADQSEYVISIVSIIAMVFSFILTVLLIKKKVYIVFVRAIAIASLSLRTYMLYLFVGKKYPYIKYNQPSKSVYLKNRWDVLGFQLSTTICLSAPVILISILCSLRTASVYSVYNLVSQGLIAIISIFTSGVSASFGNVIAKKEYDVLKEAHRQFEFSIYCITAFLSSCTLILITPFVAVYTKGVTDIIYVNMLYGGLFVIWGILYNINIPYTVMINAAGIYTKTRKINIVQVALLLTISFIFVKPYGITGMLAAMIISTLYKVAGLVLLVNRFVLPIRLKNTMLRVARIFIITALAYVPFISWIVIPEDGLILWVFWAVRVSLWCGFLTLTVNFILDKDMFIRIINRLKALMPERKSESYKF